MAFISPFVSGWDGFMAGWAALTIESGAFSHLNTGQIQKTDTTLVSSNLRVHTMSVTGNNEYNFAVDCATHEVMLTAPEGRRPFYIRIPIKVLDEISTNTFYESEALILCCANVSGIGEIAVVSPDPPDQDCIRNMWWKEPPYNYLSTPVSEYRGPDVYPTFVISSEQVARDYVSQRVGTVFRVESSTLSDIQTKFATIYRGVTYGSGFKAYQLRSSSESSTHSFSKSYQVKSGRYAMIAYEKIPFPLFDYTDTDGIIQYLNTGEGGGIDPWDPYNPEPTEVENFSTDFKLYFNNSGVWGKNPGDIAPVANAVSMTLNAQCPDYNTNRETIWQEYGLQGWIQYHTTGTLDTYDFGPVSTQNPQYNFFISPEKFKNPGDYCRIEFRFVRLTEPSETKFTKTSSSFVVKLEYDAKSKYKVKVTQVTNSYDGGTLYDVTGTKTTGTDRVEDYINGGYYTREYYKYKGKLYLSYGAQGYAIDNLYIYWGGITIDDLKYKTDDTIPNPDDQGDDSTGSDRTLAVGNGMDTYRLSQASAQELNDWIWNNLPETFTAANMDPIKCITSSCQIPFINGGTATSSVWIANGSCPVSGGTIVSMSKSFDCGSLKIGPFNGNFTDITMTKIHLYLPFIGWQDLPASEVMCRQSYQAQGVASKTYTLKFKYIVDFVDGDCRCIVSVNNTERWYFDGHCGIDMPWTSDNHAASIANARKNAVAGGLKVAGGVVAVGLGIASLAASGGTSSVASVAAVTGGIGGIASGATAIGSAALSDFPNAHPVYDYSATCSPSGVIESAMNNHIMVIVEYPNAYYPSGYGHMIGYPCERYMSLGTCTGFTKTRNVDVSGINCSELERSIIKQALDSGVYL